MGLEQVARIQGEIRSILRSLRMDDKDLRKAS